jgi:NAD(P)H-flavin reductase
MRVSFEGEEYELAAGETVLDCLHRHGQQLASMCRAGICQCCLLRVESGEIPAIAQQGLKPGLKSRGLFMPCVCRPAGDLAVARCDALPMYQARVVEVENLSPRVLRVGLSVPEGFTFSGGQFVQLVRPGDGLMRPYSIASLPGDPLLELHVALQPEGQMSQWLAHAQGECVELRGPLGECCYPDGDGERPLLLAGTGTGLAPLFAVLRSALQAGHAGPIRLFHGAAEQRELYLWTELTALADRHPNLRIGASVRDGEGVEPGVSSRPLADQALAGDLPLGESRAFLCGNPGFVRDMRKQLYLKGLPLDRIHADPFMPPTAAVTAS